MKSFTSFYYLACSLLLSVFLTIGCDTNESTEDGLVGTWRLTSMEMTVEGVTYPVPANEMMQQTIIINSDGTYSATGVDENGPYSDSGTWSTNGNNLTVVSPSEGTMNLVYSLSGNTLTLTMPMTEEGMTFEVTMIYTRQ